VTFPFATDHTVSATDDRTRSWIGVPRFRQTDTDRLEKRQTNSVIAGFERSLIDFPARFLVIGVLNFEKRTRILKLGVWARIQEIASHVQPARR
jgi:hypothetical protein